MTDEFRDGDRSKFHEEERQEQEQREKLRQINLRGLADWSEESMPPPRAAGTGDHTEAKSTQVDPKQEQIRMEEAARRIMQLDEIQPEQWATLDRYGKQAALDQAGVILSDVYHTPRPPLSVRPLGDPNTLGQHEEGSYVDVQSGEVVGGGYGTTLNQSFEYRGQQMFGDDPRLALLTYAHEFRHSYQNEQAAMFRHHQFWRGVDSYTQAEAWTRNLRNGYVPPSEGFEAYDGQRVEKDARAFADDLVTRVFGSH